VAYLTITDARDIAKRGRPWSLRLEYTGSNSSNNSGWSDKFWFATGRGINEPVEIGWGRNGNKPQIRLTDFPTVEDRVSSKLGNGYSYVDASYRRMSPESLSKLAKPTSATPLQPTPAPAPAMPASITSKHTVSAAQDALGVPWSLIHSLRIKRSKGSTNIVGYDALDENEDLLLTMTATSGLDFARDYNVEIEFA